VNSAPRLSEDFLNLLPVAAYACDAVGHITQFNRRAEELWGRRPALLDEDERGSGALRLLWPDGRLIPSAETPQAQVLRTGKPLRNQEAIFERSDGTRVPVLIHISPIRDDGGILLGAITCFQDASALQARTQELEAILDAVPAIVWVARDPAARRITGSRTAAEFLRMGPTENMSTTAPEEERPGHFRVLDAQGRELLEDRLPVQAAARGREARGLEVKVVFQDGSSRFLLGNAVPLREGDGAPRGAVAAFVDVTDRRQAEEELEDFFENGAIGCHWLGPDGTILRMNSTELRMMGYAREEVVGRPIADFHVDRRAIDDILSRLKRNEVLHDYPARVRAKDGRVMDVLIDSSVLWKDGRFVHTRCFTRDVTELNRIQAVDARLAAIVESSDDAIISKTLEGIITSWNQAAERLFGYAVEEVLGKPITIIIPEERLSEEREILSKIVRGERVDHFETVRRCKDGSLRDISLTISPMKDGSGRIIGASKIARDITERRRIQEERTILLDRERDARQTAEILNDVGRALNGLLVVERLVQAVTDAATHLTGAQFGAFFHTVQGEAGETYTLSALSGVPREKFAQVPNPRSTPLLVPTFRGQGTIRLDDVRTDHRYGHGAAHSGPSAGQLPLVSYLAVPVVSRSGEVIGGLFFGHAEPGRFRESHGRIVEGLAAQAAVAIDNARLFEKVQEELELRCRAEAEVRALNVDLEKRVRDRTLLLEEMVRELDTFAYTVAHDLRAPLRAIHTFGEMLLESCGAKLDDEEKGHLDQMVKAGGRMDLLIRDLLAYSRLSRERVSLEALDLGKIVDGALAEVRGELGDARAELTSERRLPSVLGHATALGQVILNLLRNAVKFVAPGTAPRVRVWAEDRGEWTRLWVEDNGIGIAPEHHPKLFKIFERLHGREGYPGTGVGLAIVRRGIERMGGRVGLESEPGRGSRFFIELKKPPAGGRAS
jgi:PAS domain S-box-containing protein